jgi:hypothetical protein
MFTRIETVLLLTAVAAGTVDVISFAVSYLFGARSPGH